MQQVLMPDDFVVRCTKKHGESIDKVVILQYNATEGRRQTDRKRPENELLTNLYLNVTK